MIGVLRRLRTTDGSAVPEFIVIAVGIMIPIGYIVVAVADVLGAHAAAQHAVREAGRVFVRDIGVQAGQWRAQQAAVIAFADRGLTLPSSAVDFDCQPTCLQPGGTVRVSLAWDMPLPWIPTTLGSMANVNISATEEFVVDNFRPAGLS